MNKGFLKQTFEETIVFLYQTSHFIIQTILLSKWNRPKMNANFEYKPMVYFWTYAHPLYTAHPTYKHVVLTAVVGPMYCRSDGHVKNSILVHPTYFKLSLGHVSRSDVPFS